MTPNAILRLYLASNTGSAARLLQIVNEMVDAHLGGEADVSVIDVLADPDQAESADVLITPTIDCLAPLPQRRVIGMPASADHLADALLLSHFVSRKDTQ